MSVPSRTAYIKRIGLRKEESGHALCAAEPGRN
jgi:hypothetical protein